MRDAGPIHLDNNATTRLCTAAREAMLPHLDSTGGHPSSLHAAGRRARAAIEGARRQVAALLGAQPSEVVFTSGGTEADVLAVLGALEARGERRHVVTSAVEHPAVRDLLHHLRTTGRITLSEIRPARDGTLEAEAVLAAVRDDTALVTVMTAQNETGMIFPVAAIAAGCRERGIPFHTDAVQAAGKIPLDALDPRPDLVAVAAHKIHGPQGSGALVVRRGAEWRPFPVAGHQEGGRRGGTPNTAGIVGFGAAAAAAVAALAEAPRIAALRDRFEEGALERIPGARRSTASGPRVPNTSHLLLGRCEGEQIVLRLDAQGIAVSSGAACASGALEPSHVLRAQGLREGDARAALRVSLSRETTEAEVDRALEALVRAVARG